MAYYIFLKSLRSLEEFRKNPHVKIHPKSPSINFQSLAKFKNPIFNSKIPSSSLSARLPFPAQSAYGPAGLAGPSPLPQTEAHRPTQTAHPARVIGVFAKIHFLLDFTPSVLSAYSLSPR
jgi:hypothetical protein